MFVRRKRRKLSLLSEPEPVSLVTPSRPPIVVSRALTPGYVTRSGWPAWIRSSLSVIARLTPA